MRVPIDENLEVRWKRSRRHFPSRDARALPFFNSPRYPHRVACFFICTRTEVSAAGVVHVRSCHSSKRQVKWLKISKEDERVEPILSAKIKAGAIPIWRLFEHFSYRRQNIGRTARDFLHPRRKQQSHPAAPGLLGVAACSFELLYCTWALGRITFKHIRPPVHVARMSIVSGELGNCTRPGMFFKLEYMDAA